MKNSEYQKLLKDELFEPIFALTEKKAHDYAKESDTLSNFKEQAKMLSSVFGREFRASDTAMHMMIVKLIRLANLRDKSPQNESVQDTVRDLINYAGLYYACRLDEAPAYQPPAVDLCNICGCGGRTHCDNRCEAKPCQHPDEFRLIRTSTGCPDIMDEVCELCGEVVRSNV